MSDFIHLWFQLQNTYAPYVAIVAIFAVFMIFRRHGSEEND